jgi:hypothetical protein
MSLIKKGTSSATLEANRVNACKCTGPTTERGKDASRLNAVKHWGRASVMFDLMPALGEAPEDFAAVLAGLRRALAPRDAFEAMLVADMADIHWRLRRMIRGEAAALALKRRKQQALREEDDARMAAGGLQVVEPLIVAQVGFVGLHDSPAKFMQIIGLLKALDAVIQNEGFPGDGKAFFGTIYGREPGLRGEAVTGCYKHFHEDEKAGRSEVSEANRAEFHQLLEGEIAWFEQCAARDRQAQAEMQAPRDAAPLAATKDSAAAMMYLERLERRFERKWKLLREYRRSKVSAADRSRLPLAG